ncbi:aminoglycoside N(3)-acetyltransferase [uncultured Vibrio sp.]|uniref:aminoglycoside N(3)-acetyltransferase n=1 Tax=uncultured Vibrio sp. TaxID=114054 RepID=UPI002626EF17|nr:AAC(3) family N-acetyltransferase [uncultured Vibrio sp.]
MQRLLEKERYKISSQKGLVSEERLLKQLCDLGIVPNSTLLVHSSLSSIGWVVNGEQSVLQSLIRALGSNGTLMMPAYTAINQHPSGWLHPKLPVEWLLSDVADSLLGFDPKTSAVQYVGRLPEYFRTYPEVSRSRHPLYSFCARGKNKHYLLEQHSYDFGLGESSPLGKIYEVDGYVLLLGVSFNNNSCWHLAEFFSDIKEKKVYTTSAKIMCHGQAYWQTLKELNFISDGFSSVQESFLLSKPSSYQSGYVGSAYCHLFKVREFVDFAVKHIKNHHSVIDI